ncbi:hypothetical protein VTL71DRAFT_8287 [Oculimacula yallundae]|uniref:Uncharacterized protein n=1 Tax=Oculimacula yallundae TaxID=86028 RepID=A0ABR4CZK2_9HELO
MSAQINSSARLRLPRLHDKVAIVTGGASGIGRAIALAYAREGARVVIADLNERFKGALESDVTTFELIRDDSDCDHTAIFVRTDVCSVDSVNNLVAEAVQQHGRLDIIVNAAGIAPEIHNPQPIWSISDSTWMSTMAVNTTGLLYACRAAISQMVNQSPLPTGDRGWVVNISSIYGQTAVTGNTAYCASKHAVLGITKAAALDCAPQRIRVNAICPGFTDTAMTSTLLGTGHEYQRQMEALQPLKGIGSAVDIARIAVVLASEDAGWVTGTAIAVDGDSDETSTSVSTRSSP